MTELEKQKLELENEGRLSRMEQKQEDMSKDIFEIKETLKDFIKQADKKYAPAWIATFVYTLIILIVSGLVGGAIATLFK